jgi:hypothetical protein
MSVDVDQTGLNLGDADGVPRGLGFAYQCLAFEVRLQHDFDQAFRTVGCFLGQAADSPALGDRDVA